MKGKVVAGLLAVVGAAALTLAAVIALVRATVFLSAIQNLPLRIIAVAGDLIFGTLLLVACIYLATHLAVRIVGVGTSALPLLRGGTDPGSTLKK